MGRSSPAGTVCIRSCVPLPHLRPDSCTYTRQAASAVRAVTRIACADRALACGNACPHRRGSSARALLGACEAYAMRVTLYQLSPRLSRKTQACTCTRQATSAVLSEHKHCMYRSRARPARECIPQRIVTLTVRGTRPLSRRQQASFFSVMVAWQFPKVWLWLRTSVCCPPRAARHPSMA